LLFFWPGAKPLKNQLLSKILVEEAQDQEKSALRPESSSKDTIACLIKRPDARKGRFARPSGREAHPHGISIHPTP
jgi:hypothetical protein